MHSKAKEVYSEHLAPLRNEHLQEHDRHVYVQSVTRATNLIFVELTSFGIHSVTMWMLFCEIDDTIQ